MLKHVLYTACLRALTVGLLTALPAAAELPTLDAHQVAVNVEERDEGTDEVADLEMVLVNDKGQERNRKVVAYRKDYTDNADGFDKKTVMFFKEPADVKDTGFLSWSYADPSKDDDQWLYPPALKKVRRISSSKKKDYFMGTDFTYDDMGDRNVDDYTYTHLGTEVIDGVECYHLETLPKDAAIQKKTGYGRGEMWVRPDIWFIVKMKLFNEKKAFLKELTVSDIVQIDNIWTANTLKMVNEEEKHTTIFKFSNKKFNSGLDDEIFSERRLTKGAE